MADGGGSRPDPYAMPVGELAKLLAAVGGGNVTEADLRRDLADGAPVNEDGTVNLVHYTAWLAGEVR